MRLALFRPLKCLLVLGQATIALSLISVLSRFVRAEEPFFPELLFSDDRQLDDIAVRDYASALQAMKEPSLWRLSKTDREVTVYRLLWLQWMRHPISIRILKSPTGDTLFAVELDGFSGDGYKLGKVAVEKRLGLTATQSKRLDTLLDAENPWRMPVAVREELETDDGRLVLECVSRGRYHAVDRPYVRNKLTDLQRYLLDLSGIEWQRETYFPLIKFVHDDNDDDEKMLNDLINEWYSTLLYAMKEPSLWKRAKADRKETILRLLWAPTGRHPLSIRIVHAGDSTTLFATELDGAGCDSCDPGHVITTQTMPLTPELWKQINAHLDQMKFTTMASSLDSEPKITAKQVVLEFVNAGRYHLVNRSSGKGELGKFCRFLVELPGLKWSLEPFVTNAALNPNDRDPDYLIDGHSDFLWAMGQPSLRKLARKDPKAIAVQLLYAPCFRKPFSVRIWKDRDALRLNAVQLDGAGGFQPGNVVFNKTVQLTQDQWDKLMHELDRLSFWEMPSKDPPRKEIAIDPDFLSLEQVRSGKCHYVSRISPLPDELFPLFELMITLSGVDRKTVFENQAR